MPRPYPIELRLRVVDAYNNGEGTLAELAERFKVGEASVNRWVSRERRTGNVAPSPMGGARRTVFDEAGETFIAQVLADVPDTTGVELVAAYAEEFGVTVGVSTMNEKLRRMGYTVKRGSSARQLRNEPTSSSGARLSSNSSKR